MKWFWISSWNYVFGLARILVDENDASLQQKPVIVMNTTSKQLFPSWKRCFTPEEDLDNETENLLKPSVLYRSLPDSKILSSVSTCRLKVEYSPGAVNIRFVVTSLATDKVPPGELYTQKYCPRGDGKSVQRATELFSDRTTHTFEGNQFWLWFHLLPTYWCTARTVFGDYRVALPSWHYSD